MDAFERLEKAIGKANVMMRTDEEGNWILQAGRLFKDA